MQDDFTDYSLMIAQIKKRLHRFDILIIYKITLHQ